MLARVALRRWAAWAAGKGRRRRRNGERACGVALDSSGEIIQLGGPGAAGDGDLDLLGPVVGSEGMLGLVTEVTLRLVPTPDVTETILAVFPSLDAACDTGAEPPSEALDEAVEEDRKLEAKDCVKLPRINPFFGVKKIAIKVLIFLGIFVLIYLLSVAMFQAAIVRGGSIASGGRASSTRGGRGGRGAE